MRRQIGILYSVILFIIIKAERNPFLFKRIGSTRLQSDTGNSPSIEDNGLTSEGISTEEVFIAADCDQSVILSPGQTVIINSPLSRNELSCKTTVKANEEGRPLSVVVHEMNIKFNCFIESLNIIVDNTSVLLCRGSDPVNLYGANVTLEFTRRITENFGRYTISVTNPITVNSDVIMELNDAENCGIIKADENTNNPFHTRVVGGVDASIEDFPWIANLKLISQTESFTCGGALISARHIITGAHCFSDDTHTVEVILGTNINEYNSAKTKVGKKYRTHNFHIHKDYDTLYVINDIALVTLQEKVEFSDVIRPLCLPSKEMGSMTDETATIAGFGKLSYEGKAAEILQRADLRVHSWEECNHSWGYAFDVEITKTQVCALGRKLEDACIGDSGSSLVLKKNGRYIGIGITSYGYECSVMGLPGIYTKTQAYTDWIKENMEK